LKGSFNLNKKIAILGSTGSIGTQSLEVVKNIGNIDIVALTAKSNIELIEKQIREFKPKIAVLVDKKKAEQLKKNIADTNVKVLYGIEGLIEASTVDEIDTVVNSVVGNIGLEPTIAAIRSKKNIALANKETLVSSGELVMKEVNKNGVNLYPIDSEHSAIFQALAGNEKNKIYKIHLTASGGPFRNYTDLSNVTVEDALNHPNWTMGKKITIDSATLMNKGLEVIEAKWLFDVDVEKINVIIHPQSIIHSMVEYEDGAVIAQLGEPDMKIPIQYALTYPKRLKNNFSKIDFFKRNNLTFEKPNTKLFKCLDLAFRAIKIGGTMPAVLNAANETAVENFINGKIKFLDIPKLIEMSMNEYNTKYNYTLTDVINADNWARTFVEQKIAEVEQCL